MCEKENCMSVNIVGCHCFRLTRSIKAKECCVTKANKGSAQHTELCMNVRVGRWEGGREAQAGSTEGTNAG